MFIYHSTHCKHPQYDAMLLITINVLINVLLLGVTMPDVTFQSRIYEVLLTWTHTVHDCYEDIVFTYSVMHCFIITNGSSKTCSYMSMTENKEYTINELEPSTKYSVTVTASSKENPDIYSNPGNIETTTLGNNMCIPVYALYVLYTLLWCHYVYIARACMFLHDLSCLCTHYQVYFSYHIDPIGISVSQQIVCYGQSVVVSCYYGNLINNGPIYNKTNPTILLVDSEVCKLGSSHVKTIDISAEDSRLVNGEVEISCAVLYDDDSRENSNRIVVKGTCKFRFISACMLFESNNLKCLI